MFESKDIPEEKRTKLDLYVTAKEAYEMWKADPLKVKILDVRTPEEYEFVGHPEMALNIPLLFMTHQWDSTKNQRVFVPNSNFTTAVKSHYSSADIILATCRSGGRSAAAVNAMTAHGFNNAYSIVDGMEGDLDKDPTSPHCGKRSKNGWKNSGAPWTYEVRKELLWIKE